MKVVARNKRAWFDYEILKKFEAGVVLKGWEIKSIRIANTNIKTAFILISKNEVIIKNMFIGQYMNVKDDEVRDRKLLLTKRQIKTLWDEKEQKRLQIVPLKLFLNNKGLAKVEIALGRSKKKSDKRETIRKRDIDRKIKKVIKNSY